MNHGVQVARIATSALDCLRLACQENSAYHTGGALLIAVTLIAELHEELALPPDLPPADPAEYCFPV